MGDGILKIIPKRFGVLKHGKHVWTIRRVRAGGLEYKAKHKHGYYRPYWAERNKAEAILLSVLVGSYRCRANAQRHYERHGHGAGCNAAGIERNGKEFLGNEYRHDEYCSIETDKQIIKRYFEHDAQHGNHKKYAHAHGYRDYNRHIWNVRDLLCQYLKVRLGNGYDYSNNKANEGNEPQLSWTGYSGTYFAADRRHCKVSTQREQPHAQNKHYCANYKGNKNVGGHRHNGEAQHEYNGRYRQDRGKRFLQLFIKYRFVGF